MRLRELRRPLLGVLCWCARSASSSSAYRIARREASALRSFCADLAARGLVAHTHPPALVESNFVATSTLPDVLYAGFDPTAESLHVGNLLIVNGLLRAALHGCRSIALVGEATALVGDPSGRHTDRTEMAREVAANNSKKLRAQFDKLFANFESLYGKEAIGNRMTLVSNAYWHTEMSWLDFMRICRWFRVGTMQRMGALKERIRSGEGVACSEFLYQVMQSHDWYRLADQYDCFFQLGGSDQLGHVDAGYNYIRQRLGHTSAGVCLPIIVDRRGAKMGKSSGTSSANIWLDAAKTSPFAFFQFWKQMPDSEITPFVKYYSLRPLEEIDEMLSRHAANLGGWVAQEWLARELTLLVHGPEALDDVVQFSKMLFTDSFEELKKLSTAQLEAFFGDASIVSVPRDSVRTVGDLAERTRDNGKATKVLVTKGAFKLNGERFTVPDERLDSAKLRFGENDLTLVCWGKRAYQLVRWTD